MNNRRTYSAQRLACDKAWLTLQRAKDEYDRERVELARMEAAERRYGPALRDASTARARYGTPPPKAAIIEAVDAGLSLRDVANMVGLSRQRIHQILDER